MTAEQLIQSLKICEDNRTCEGCILIDYSSKDKHCRESLIRLICLAVLGTLRNTAVKADYLEAVEKMKKLVEDDGFSLSQDE